MTLLSATKKLPSSMWRSCGGGVKVGVGSSRWRVSFESARTWGSRATACFELLGEIAVAQDAVAFTSVERVFAGPVAQDHFGMVEEVSIDWNFCAIDRKRGDLQPVVIDVAGGLTPVTLAKEDDVGHHGGSFAFEGIRRQPNGPHEVGLGGEVFANRGVLLVEREMRGHQRHHPAGFQGVDRLGEEVVVKRILLPLVVELDVRERDVADNGVDAVLGQAACRGNSRSGSRARGA